jgi:hypothetical protein
MIHPRDKKECGAADGAAALRPLPLRKNAARAGPKIARLPHDLHPEPGEAGRESGGAGGLGVPGPWTGNCLESAAFAPGRRTGRGLPIPASETEPCRGMPERGPFAFSIPSPLMSASRVSCGGRGGRVGAFLRPPTPPPGPFPGVSRRISRETTRIRPPRPDGAFRPRPFAGIPGNPRLSPGRPAVDYPALHCKDDPGSAGESPGNARVGSRETDLGQTRSLGRRWRRHRPGPSGSLALPAGDARRRLVMAHPRPARTRPNGSPSPFTHPAAYRTRPGCVLRIHKNHRNAVEPCLVLQDGVLRLSPGSGTWRGSFPRSRPEKPGRARSPSTLPALSDTTNDTTNDTISDTTNGTARP